MEIKTERTHTITFTNSELNTLRCFLEDAINAGVNHAWGDEIEVIRGMHDSFAEAFHGRK